MLAPKPPAPVPPKKTSVTSVLLLVAAGSSLSIALFLFVVRTRLNEDAQSALTKVALALLFTGMAAMLGAVLARRRT